MTEKELRVVAINTVIKYAEEQGVKLRRIDFERKDTFDSPISDSYYINQYGDIVYRNYVSCVRAADDSVISVMVKISYTGRWERQLKAAKERFLNYLNARLEEHYLSFSFTVRELEIIYYGASNADADNDKIDNVIKKINKLLALSDQSRNNSENEAIAASLQVQRLLAKYNLSMADVTGERKEEEVEQSIADVGNGRKWKYTLANVIANNFACKNYIVGHEQIVFFGYKADIIAARRVFVYLFNVGDKLAKQYAKKFREEQGAADGVYNSFCLGFIAGVKKELDKQCVALSIVVQPKVQERWEQFTAALPTMKNSGIKANNVEAYKEGFVEGKRALNAQYLES